MLPLPAWYNEDEDDDDEDDDDETVETSPKPKLDPACLYCKTREITRVDSEAAAASSRLILSGSRGIGVVVSNQPGGTLMEVLDLEENEEEEEDDDDDEEMEGDNDDDGMNVE